MALTTTGPISMGDINVELGRTRTASISLDAAENGSYASINQNSPSKPSSSNPATISEWRGYNHSTSDTIPPSIPLNIYCDYGSGETFNSIYIAWDQSTDNVAVTGYQLQRRTSSSTVWSTRYTGTGNSFQDSANSDTGYYYQVRSFDAAGNYSNFSTSAYWYTPPRVIVCFIEGTLITLPDGTQKPIENLVITELLLSSEIETLDDTNDVKELYKWSCDYLLEKRISSPITKIEPKIVNQTIIINDGLLEATPEHSQLIQRHGIWKFIPIKNIIVGDKLYGQSKEIITITSVSINLEEKKVYPLSLNPSHTYFANRILTHNIKKEDPK